MDTTTTPSPGQLIQVTGPTGFNWKCGRCPGTAWVIKLPADGGFCVYETDGRVCGAPRSEGTWTKGKPRTYQAKVSKVKPAVTGLPLAMLKLAGEKGLVATPWTPDFVTTWKAA